MAELHTMSPAYKEKGGTVTTEKTEKKIKSSK